jgi:adenosylcobyric acid synthase
VEGELAFDQGRISGYEIHAGETIGDGLSRPFCHVDGRADGAISDDGQIMGSYIHGLFEQTESLNALLRWAGVAAVESIDYHALRERDIERLADLVEQHLDTDTLKQLCGKADE